MKHFSWLTFSLLAVSTVLRAEEAPPTPVEAPPAPAAEAPGSPPEAASAEAPAPQDSSQPEEKKLEKKLEETQDDADQVPLESIDALQGKLNTLREEEATLTHKAYLLRTQMAAVRAKIDEANKQRREKQKKEAAQKKEKPQRKA